MLALMGAFCLVYGALFIIRGAWPIGIFFGADFTPALRRLLAELPFGQGAGGSDGVAHRCFDP